MGDLILTNIEKSSNSRLRQGVTISVLIALFSLSVFLMVGSGNEVILTTVQPEGLSPEVRDYFSPPGTKEQAPFALTDISDEDFVTAEVAVTIEYNLNGINLTDYSNATLLAKGATMTAALKITVGVEETPQGTEKIAGVSLQSLTGLRAVASQRNSTLWNNSLQDRLVTQKVRNSELGDGNVNSTVTTFAARVQELGFAKDDLLIRPDERQWFIQIQDPNPIPSYIPGEEYERPCAVLRSFNITIGDIRYSSLGHPLFTGGWTVTADIAGRRGEIFRRTAPSSESGRTLGLLGHEDELDEKYESTYPLHGIAGVIGIAYFDDGEGTLSKEDPKAVKDFIKDTGIWEYYYMVTDSASNLIDDSDMEWLLDVCVDNRLGTPRRVDNVFWYISSHGGHDWLGNGYVASSYDNNELWDHELLAQEYKITLDDAYLFYWADSCDGHYLDLLWANAGFHRNHFLIWYYTTSMTGLRNRELPYVEKHVDYARRSVQWMFQGSGGSYPYKYRESVKWIEDAFEDVYPEHDMRQKDKMTSTGYKFCFVPTTGDWISYNEAWQMYDTPCARTAGEPSDLVVNYNWDWIDRSYQFEAWESQSPGTQGRYVGFYQTIYLAYGSQARKIWIEFDGRATSNYAGSSVTNLYVAIYRSNWQTSADGWFAIVNPGAGTDSGWRFSSHEFDMLAKDGTAGAYYNVFICYTDAWSAYWNQHIYAKNIYLQQYRA